MIPKIGAGAFQHSIDDKPSFVETEIFHVGVNDLACQGPCTITTDDETRLYREWFIVLSVGAGYLDACVRLFNGCHQVARQDSYTGMHGQLRPEAGFKIRLMKTETSISPTAGVGA